MKNIQDSVTEVIEMVHFEQHSIEFSLAHISYWNNISHNLLVQELHKQGLNCYSAISQHYLALVVAQ